MVLRGLQWYAVRRYGLHVFLECMAMVVLKFVTAPDPCGDRGDIVLMVPWGDGGVCRLLYDVCQIMSLRSLYRCGPRSSGPQPKWSVAETPLPAKSHGRNVDRFHLPQVLLRDVQQATTTVGCPGQNGLCVRSGPRASWRFEPTSGLRHGGP